MNFQRPDGTYQCPEHGLSLKGPPNGLLRCPICEFVIDFSPPSPPLKPGDAGFYGPCGPQEPDLDCPEGWP